MPALMISQVTVTNQEKFQDYFAITKAIGAKYGAKAVARGTHAKVLNGTGDGHQMVVVVEFPSMEQLEAWYGSEDYKAIIPLREAGSHQSMMAYEAQAVPSQL